MAVLSAFMTSVLSACVSTPVADSGEYAAAHTPRIPPPAGIIPPPQSSSRLPSYNESGTTPPHPSFEFENTLPDPRATPAYKKSTRAEDEQRITAERLAQWQRSGSGLSSITTTGLVTQGVQPALVPAVQTSYSAPVTQTAMPTEGPGYAQTDYYAGDYAGSSSGAVIPPMPQSARPGECYALVRTPEQYRSVSRDYVVRPGYDSIQVTPARYESQQQSYVSNESYERLEIIPATFKTVSEGVEVSPPSVRYLASEPVYETVSERILETPARQTWKRGRGPIQRVDNATGEVMCLVEEPAVYKTVTRKVLKQQPQMREVQVPGEYRTVTRRVVDQPAQVRRVVVPEQRSTMTVQRLVQPASYNTVRVPDQMGSITARELTAPSTLEWRPVLCETNMNDSTVTRVQRALKSAGFDPGPIDGKAGARTMDALNAYQRSKGLPEDRYLNLQTLQALGVSSYG